jgi:hypothetical protein
LLGNGILIGAGVSGDVDPTEMARTLAPVAAAWSPPCCMTPVVRLIVSRLFFGGIPFRTEICKDRNLAAGIVEMIAHALMATVAVGLMR